MALKSIAIFLTGFIAGMSVPYKFFKNKYREEKEFEIESVIAYKDDEIRELKIRLGDIKETDDAPIKKEEKTEEDPTAHRQDFSVKSSLELDSLRVSRENFTDYSLYSKQAYEAGAAEKEYPKEDDDAEKADEYTQSPIEIDYAEYEANRFYSKIELTYYVLDDQMVREEFDSTEEDEFISDQEEAFGDVLIKSGFKDNDVNTIYIRNFQTSTDYNIKKVFGHYLA